MEIGSETGAAVAGIFRQAGWSEISIHEDYAGCERVAIARIPARVG